MPEGSASIGLRTPTVLARCAFADRAMARYEPLLVATDAGWRRIADPKANFPDVGKVFCPEGSNAPHPTGSLWIIATETNARYVANRGLDRLLAREIRVAVPVLHLFSTSLEDARQQLVEVGLPPTQVPYDEALFRLRDGLCVRLRLFTDATTGRRRADVDGLEDLPLLQYEEGAAAGADLDGVHFVLPGREPGEVVDRVDWSLDHDFLPRVLKRIRRAGRDAGQTGRAGLSNAAIEMLASFVQSSGILPAEADGLRRMRRRAEDFLPRFRASAADLDSLVETLRTFEPVATRIADEIAVRRRELEADLRSSLEPVVLQELKQAHAAAAAKVDAELAEAAEAERLRGETERRVDALRDAARALEATLASEVGILHDALEAVPDASPERMRELAHRVSQALAGTVTTADVMAPATPPWALGLSDHALIVSIDRLYERLDEEADRNGLDVSDLVALDALLRAGEFVIFPDGNGRDLLDAYARCVAGGRVRRFALDPSMIGLDDLWRQPSNGYPTAFARAWTAARAHPDRIVVLAVECMTTAPLAFWLPALVDELQGDARPPNLLFAGSIAAGPWADGSRLSGLLGLLAPVCFSTAPDAWVRAALRGTGLETPEPPTVLDVSHGVVVNQAEVAEMTMGLAGIAGLTPAAAARAGRVLRATQGAADRTAALRLALDLARVAVMADPAAETLKIDTACLARGMRRLREVVVNGTN